MAEAAFKRTPGRGRFISFEGGEGSGKSTQIRILAERLDAAKVRAIVTREPGGSPGAESIRALLVTGQADRWSPVTETLLMYAARRDHIERAIAPALAAGAWVVSFTLLGYVFGAQDVVRHNFTYVIAAIIVISVLPGVIEFVRARRAAAAPPAPAAK